MVTVFSIGVEGEANAPEFTSLFMQFVLCWLRCGPAPFYKRSTLPGFAFSPIEKRLVYCYSPSPPSLSRNADGTDQAFFCRPKCCSSRLLAFQVPLYQPCVTSSHHRREINIDITSLAFWLERSVVSVLILCFNFSVQNCRTI